MRGTRLAWLLRFTGIDMGLSGMTTDPKNDSDSDDPDDE